MTLSEIGLLLISICASVMGQLFLKLGALKLGAVTFTNVGDHLLRIVRIPELILGLVSYGMGAIAYILLLTRVNLSIAGPSAASVYIFTVLLGYFFFQESLSTVRLVGIGLIICGVVLLTTKA